MFSKKDGGESATDTPRNPTAPAASRSPGSASGSRAAATIGPSIRINGDLAGEEDLIVEGRITGTVELKSNTLTIGAQGQVEARVYAHTILVEGTVNGDLYASERISIRQSARIEGNIYAPRISLEDGARFRGAIDMDTDNEAFRKAFGTASAKPAPAASAEVRPSSGSETAGKPAKPAANGGGSASSSSNVA
ncbi:polymer-forming cytoskeletal protein [Wenzhouxiangella sp. XN79A]|uniref:bactofilin family protein n=1 Tax=Wenzhouxiangella sp. XN79A TaxID=2724193 RepID=UPI001F0D9E08|nr:polymer-forming cytoskeletal protein [Wenzhouxiangella sp. XN79A]